MGHSVGVILFVVGALCVMVAWALVLVTTVENERRELPWHEGAGRWMVMGLTGFAVEVVGLMFALGVA